MKNNLWIKNGGGGGERSICDFFMAHTFQRKLKFSGAFENSCMHTILTSSEGMALARNEYNNHIQLHQK